MVSGALSQCGHPDCKTWRSEPCGEGCYWQPQTDPMQKMAFENGVLIGNLTAERDRYRSALEEIEAAALRNNGPLARDHCEDQMRGIGLKAQNAIWIEAAISQDKRADKGEPL
jgi:hypothetical protein